MTVSDIDRQRAKRLMQDAGLDALVLMQPEAFRYAIGAAAGVASMWGRAGAAIALVPAEENGRLAAIASDHAAGAIRATSPDIDLRTHRVWIDAVDLTGVSDLVGINAAYGSGGARPQTFDRELCFRLLGDLLRERGLDRGRIGLDFEYIPAADFHALQQALPDIAFSDGSEVLRRLRMVKTAAEIRRLRRAASAAEAGLEAMARAIEPGVAVSALSDAWRAGAAAFAQGEGFALSGHWDFISVGPDLSDSRAVVVPGAVIKADVGTLVEGYSSDGARSFVHGAPSPLAQTVFSALSNAFSAGLEQLRPGNRFASVHEAMTASMRQDGFEHYGRGHFGHSVGGSVGIEEWPFFSAESDVILEPNMVVALEAPFYGQGLGALMIEDQFLMTQTGAEPMYRLPRGLVDVSQKV